MIGSLRFGAIHLTSAESGAVLSKAKDIYILDFNGPGFLDIWQDHLYFFDGRNVRIASVDLALAHLNYYKPYDGAPLTNNFYAIGPHRFIGVSLTPIEEEAHNRIKVIDTHSYSTYSFFDENPIQVNTGRRLSQKALYMGFYLNPKFGIDKGSGRMLISFVYPHNPVDFFISEDGYLLASKSHDETERLYIYKLGI